MKGYVMTVTHRQLEIKVNKLASYIQDEKETRKRIIKTQKEINVLFDKLEEEKIIEDKKKLEADRRREIREFKVELAAQRRAEREITC